MHSRYDAYLSVNTADLDAGRCMHGRAEKTDSK